MPGISMSWAMRPQPIWPIWILLLGASAPRTEEGMMVGSEGSAGGAGQGGFEELPAGEVEYDW